MLRPSQIEVTIRTEAGHGGAGSGGDAGGNAHTGPGSAGAITSVRVGGGVVLVAEGELLV